MGPYGPPLEIMMATKDDDVITASSTLNTLLVVVGYLCGILTLKNGMLVFRVDLAYFILISS